MIDVLPQTFICQVVRVHDGDGPLWCANGIRVRIAGVQAPDFEDAEPCRRHHRGYVCGDAAAAVSRRKVEALVLRTRLACRSVDVSYGRVVARCTLPNGEDLSCAILGVGAARRWELLAQLPDGSVQTKAACSRGARLTPERERWAEALAIERLRGDDALSWIAQRIEALAAAGDKDGVARFTEIADRVGRLCASGSTQ